MGIPRLQRLIESSSLPEEDKDLWVHALEGMDDDDADAVLGALAGDEHLQRSLDALTRNIKLKRIAMADGDAALYRNIVEEELEQVNEA